VTWRLRMRVRLTRGVLDRQLAGGVTAGRSPALALRADQLRSPEVRRTIARLLGTILEAAEERSADPGSPLIVNHTAVLDARGDIQALITRLRSPATLDPCGIAHARLLVRDSRSPLFSAASDRTLRDALSEIAAQIAPDELASTRRDASSPPSSRNLDGGARYLHVAFTDPRLR
jgi:hypothetical protein